MKKRIISLYIACMFLLLAVPTMTAFSLSEEESNDLEWETFSSCYIDASGDISGEDWSRILGSNMWKLSWFRPFFNDFAVVSYWRIVFDESSSITLYTEKDGEVLWDHDGTGHPQFRILGFFGDYIPTCSENTDLHVKIRGQILFALKNVR